MSQLVGRLYWPPPYFSMWAVERLRGQGHVVEQQDILGLWRINGGPEITYNQLVQIACRDFDTKAPK
jgi:hypothetical protein